MTEDPEDLILVPEPTPAESDAARILALENEVVRLTRLLEQEADDRDRQASDTDEGWARDSLRDEAEDIRERLARKTPGNAFMERVNQAEARIETAEAAQQRAAWEFESYRRDTEKVRAFARWLSTEFSGLFDLNRIATGYQCREARIEKALRELMKSVELAHASEHVYVLRQAREVLGEEVAAE